MSELAMLIRYREAIEVLAYMGVFKDADNLIRDIESGAFSGEYEIIKAAAIHGAPEPGQPAAGEPVTTSDIDKVIWSWLHENAASADELFGENDWVFWGQARLDEIRALVKRDPTLQRAPAAPAEAEPATKCKPDEHEWTSTSLDKPYIVFCGKCLMRAEFAHTIASLNAQPALAEAGPVATVTRPYDNSGFNVEWHQIDIPDNTKLYAQPRAAVPADFIEVDGVRYGENMIRQLRQENREMGAEYVAARAAVPDGYVSVVSVLDVMEILGGMRQPPEAGDDVLGVCRRFIAEYNSMREQFFAAAPSPDSAEVVPADHKCSLVLSAKILREVLGFANTESPDSEDFADHEETEMGIQWMPARMSDEGEPMPAGYYCWYHDYPEEGCLGPLGEPSPDDAGGA